MGLAEKGMKTLLAFSVLALLHLGRGCKKGHDGAIHFHVKFDEDGKLPINDGAGNMVDSEDYGFLQGKRGKHGFLQGKRGKHGFSSDYQWIGMGEGETTSWFFPTPKSYFGAVNSNDYQGKRGKHGFLQGKRGKHGFSS